jgi:hypothetical protein
VSDPTLIPPALDRIDPRSRALIELTHRRGLPDTYIEELLGLGNGDLADRRAAAEEELAAELDLAADELRDSLAGLDERGWAGEEPEPEEGSSGIGRWVAALIAGIAVAAIVVIVIVANEKDEEPATKAAPAAKTTPSEAKTSTTAAPAAAADGLVVVLDRLNGTNGQGTAQLLTAQSGKRVHLKVRDFLEPQGGGYAVWLFNSPEDARLLQSTEQTDFDVTLPLSANYKRYRFIDVSREADENPGHMGLSLLRAPLARLEAR